MLTCRRGADNRVWDRGDEFTKGLYVLWEFNDGIEVACAFMRGFQVVFCQAKSIGMWDFGARVSWRGIDQGVKPG